MDYARAHRCTMILNGPWIWALLIFILILPSSLNGAEDSEDFLSESDIMFFGQEFVVTVSKTQEPQRLAPGNITVILRSEIDQKGIQTLAELLQTVPGFFVEESISEEVIYIRGLKESILVLVDGVPLAFQGNRDSYPKTEDLSLDFVDRIEIIRGPSSTIWGINAFGAVINLITKKTEEPYGRSGSVEIGSFNQSGLHLGAGERLFDQVDLYLSASYQTTQEHPFFLKQAPLLFDLEEDAILTTQDTTTLNQQDWYLDLYGRVLWKDLEISGRFSDFKDLIPISSFSLAPLGEDENSVRSNPSWFVQTTFHPSLGDLIHLVSSAYLAGYDQDSQVRLFPSSQPLQNHPQGGALILEADNLSAFAEMRVHIDPNPKLWSILFGGSYLANFSDRTGAVLSATEPPSQEETKPNFIINTEDALFSFYSQGQYAPLNGLNLTLGLRYDHPNNSQYALNPKAAAIFHFFDPLTIKLLYGEATQSPDLFDSEQISAQIQDGIIQGISTQSNLKPEKIRTFEGQLLFTQTDLLDLNATVYYSLVSDLIVEEISQNQIVEPQNQEGGSFAGTEWTLSLWPSGPRLVNPYLAWAFEETVHSIDNLTDVPTHTVYGGARMHLAEQATVQFYCSWVDRRTFDPDFDRAPLDSYLLGNLSFLFRSEKSRFVFMLAIKNLWDTTYFNRNSDLPLPGPGRQFFTRLSVQF